MPLLQAKAQRGSLDLLANDHAVEQTQAAAVWVRSDGWREESVLLKYFRGHLLVEGVKSVLHRELEPAGHLIKVEEDLG